MTKVIARDVWQSITLTADEQFKVDNGAVRFHNKAAVPTEVDAENFGAVYEAPDSIVFKDGVTVYYRNAGERSTLSTFGRLDA